MGMREERGRPVRWERSTSPCVSVRVPAKLNLFLSVRGRRPDGYHELVTVFQSVSLFDRVRAGLIGPPGQGHHPAARRRMRVALWHDGGPDVPSGTENLAVRAARALGDAAGVIDLAFVDARATRLADPEVDHAASPYTVLDLRKTIPVGAGMAGGSADAAAALVALNELWHCDLSRDDLRTVAAEVGSDVPFCVVGGTALASGRGTALAQVLCRGTFHWVVCTAAEPLGTAEVYRSWDRVCAVNEVQPDAVVQALRNSDAEALGAALHNDLEPAAFALRPQLADAKRVLLHAGALGAVLSGSGPTMLALCESAAAATALAERVQNDFDGVRTAVSPAGGPELGTC
ncbi:MAG TPA: 4-(cytidine 5'-diphospho)-2-C-methyl-D-erythritol kinase [Egibacteraceae bacterium]|nr:4-(cytidine 5'-diphospho)-2-C-methyl-D-erythritol kinase [Egibacteraceae bacterium]